MRLDEFLLARIAEREAAARASQDPDPEVYSTGGYDWRLHPQPPDASWATSPGWVLIEPRHVLAECEAKRRIVELHRTVADKFGEVCASCGDQGCCGRDVDAPCDTSRQLALPYADHPDYRDEWRA